MRGGNHRGMLTAALGLWLVSGAAVAQDAEPAPTSPPPAADPSAVEAQLLAAVAMGAQTLGAGAEQVGVIRMASLRQGQARTFPLTLAAQRCYAVVASGESALANLDVTIERGRTVLARDTETTSEARVRHCTGASAVRASVRLRAFRGAGRAALAFYTTPVEAAAASDATGAPGAGPSALDRLAELVTASARDFAQVSAPMRETATRGQRVIQSIVLSPGRCYRVLGAGEATVLDLDLAVLAPSGVELVRDATDDGVPTLGVRSPFCPATPGTYQLVATVERGEGAFAMQVFGSGQGAMAAAAAAPRYRAGGSGTDFVATRVRAAHARLAAGAEVETDLIAGSLQTNQARELRFPVRAGRCYVVIAAGVPSMRELDVQVLDGYGNEMARDATHDAFPSAQACPQVTGTWRATVRAFAGYGAFGAQVFSVPR